MRALLLSFVLCGSVVAQNNNEAAPDVQFGTTVVVNSGFKGTVYKYHKYAPHLPGNFARLKALGTIYTSELNVPPQNFERGFAGVTKLTEGFAIDYTGNFWINQPGEYRFTLESDDGSKFYIDDHLVIDNDGVHPPVTKGGSVQLAEGKHSVRVSYFQGPRYSVALVLKVSEPGQGYFHIFNLNSFKPAPDSPTWQQSH